MARVEAPEEFRCQEDRTIHTRTWFAAFLPELHRRGAVLEPAQVPDRRDGKLAHGDGLNFSRAWALYRISRALGDTGDPVAARCHAQLFSSP